MTSEKSTLVLVDDEERMLTVLNALFRRDYNIFKTDDGHKALDYIKQNKVHVIISDQRMPILPGVELLTQVKTISPNTVRLLLTGYADLQATIDSVNEAEVFRYINKPWSNIRLKEVVAEAMVVSHSLFDGDKTDAAAIAEVPQAQSKLVSGVVNESVAEKKPADIKAKKQPIKAPVLNILVIDKPSISRRIQKLVKAEYKVYQATSIEQSFEVLSLHEISLIISEITGENEEIQVMLEKLKQEYPQIITIILSSTADSQFVASLINHAQIYRFLPKKHLSPILLKKSIDAGMKQHLALKTKPTRIKQYQVEENTTEEKAGIGSKVLSFLKRLRQKK